MIKTEQVIQRRPDTIDSYEDIASRPKVKPVWAKPFSDHWDFRDAPVGSAAARIWAKALAIGLRDCFYEFEAASVKQLSMDAIAKRSVWLGTGYLVDFIITNGCAMAAAADAFTDVNVWMKQDMTSEATPEKLLGLMKAAGMLQESSVILDTHTMRAFEGRLFQVPFQMLNFIYSDKGRGSRRVRECMSNQLIFPMHDVMASGLNHYRSILRLLLITCIGIGIPCIIMEKLLFARTGRRRSSLVAS